MIDEDDKWNAFLPQGRISWHSETTCNGLWVLKLWVFFSGHPVFISYINTGNISPARKTVIEQGENRCSAAFGSQVSSPDPRYTRARHWRDGRVTKVSRQASARLQCSEGVKKPIGNENRSAWPCKRKGCSVIRNVIRNVLTGLTSFDQKWNFDFQPKQWSEKVRIASQRFLEAISFCIPM